MSGIATSFMQPFQSQSAVHLATWIDCSPLALSVLPTQQVPISGISFEIALSDNLIAIWKRFTIFVVGHRQSIELAALKKER